MQGKAAYIRHKVIGPCASGSYMHQTVLFSFVFSSRLAAPKHFGEQKNLFHYDVARLNPSGVNPYFFQTLKKAACVRIAGSTSPAKTLNVSSISNHLKYKRHNRCFCYMSSPNLKSWPECLQTIEEWPNSST
jgi:hypothetical protein